MDPGLIRDWLCARSLARGLPQPVPDHGGWRVDSDLPEENKRYVFAAPVPGLQALGRTVDDPRSVLKLCASASVMACLLPGRWAVADTGTVMTLDDPMGGSAALPPGYRLELDLRGPVTPARIMAGSGELAASGFAVEWNGVFVFDRIRTETPHRRRGLGSALIRALADGRSQASSRFVLVATEAGRALYQSLGWRAVSPYATARLRAGSGGT